MVEASGRDGSRYSKERSREERWNGEKGKPGRRGARADIERYSGAEMRGREGEIVGDSGGMKKEIKGKQERRRGKERKIPIKDFSFPKHMSTCVDWI